MILVTGATGFVGRYLVPKLAQQGLQVRVFIPLRRRRIPWDNHPNIELVDGSIFEPEQLYRAMTGVHTVFHLASAQWWGRRSELEYVDLGGTRNVITAGRSARIGRLIVMSHLGAQASSGFTLLRVKGEMEEAVRKSGLAHTIVRCGVLFGEDDRFVNNIAMGLRINPLFVLQPGEAENLLNPLHIDDLTDSLVATLEAIETVDATIEIGGPEYISFNEMLRTVMRVSGAPRQIVEVPPYFSRALVSLFNRLTPRWPMTPQWFDILAGNRTADLGNLYQYTGVRPRRFEDTLLTYMPQRRYRLELLRFVLRRRPRPIF